MIQIAFLFSAGRQHVSRFSLGAIFTAVLLLCGTPASAGTPPGCRPAELVINREHPLIILYGPGSPELMIKCWANLPADIKPYSILTMDPAAHEIPERLETWRKMLALIQPQGIPIALQVCGDEAEWTTPLWVIETLLKEFSCIKVVQIVEVRCAYYTRFAGELDMAIPPNLRYIGEVLKLCARYGKHLSLQIQADMVHLATDQLAGPLRDLFRTYSDYFLPQNECIGPSYYSAQAATWGLWLAGYCGNWGMEPQWWWWTKGESYFIRPGVFGVDAALETDENRYARLYRAFIIEGALMGATVYSIEPPQDVWHGEGTDERHFDKVIYPTLRQIIDQKLIATPEDVLKRARVAYQLPECSTLSQYDSVLQDLDLEVANGFLERAAYGVLLPHLMKEMIPDTGGRYYFIPLLPVGTPETLRRRFDKVIRPRECSSTEQYRELLNRYYPPTENTQIDENRNANAETRIAPGEGRACVLKCGNAIAVMQSRENLFEKQPFTVELPRWVTGLQAQRTAGGARLDWQPDPAASAFRVWRRKPGAQVYPEWELFADNVRQNSCSIGESGTFGVTAVTGAKALLQGTLNFGEYLLFNSGESPIIEQAVLEGGGSRVERIAFTDGTLPAKQEVWKILDGVPPHQREKAEAVLQKFKGLIEAFEARDLDRLMSFYDPSYRDSNGYSTEYVRRAWLWWFQRTVVPYVTAQVRTWDLGNLANGEISFIAWNRFRGTIVWDEPFGYHGRVRIPRHDDDQVKWTWKKNKDGEWLLVHTQPALPNFGEMLWIGRGHDIKHQMSDFADTPQSSGMTNRSRASTK